MDEYLIALHEVDSIGHVKQHVGAGDKVFSALTGSFDNHLVKAVQAGVLAAILGLIFVYTIK